MKGTLFRSLDALAREHAEKAVETIAEIMNDPFAESRDRLRAAEQVLDRGFGKPVSATISVPANKQQQALLAAMSDDELMVQIQGAPLPRLAADEGDDPLLR